MDEPQEVVIAGGGIVGATLALALGGAGLRVAVADAAANAPGDARAFAVSDGAMRLWTALGVGEAIAAQAQPIRRMEISGAGPVGASGGRGHGLLGFDADELGDAAAPLGWMVEHGPVRAALTAALTEAGVDVLATTVTGLEVEARSVRVALADGRTLDAALAVGAEGRRSAVRTAAGIAAMGWPYPQAGLSATLSVERPHEGAAHQLFLPGGPLALLPLAGDRFNLTWSVPEAEVRALVDMPAEAFEAHLMRRVGDRLGRLRLIGPRTRFPLALQLAETQVGPRVALVGDAAQTIHPVAGQGLNLGLKDVAALAEVVVEARRLGEDVGAPAVLERYARWRRFDRATVAGAADVFARTFSSRTPLVRALGGAALSAAHAFAPARRMFMREAGAASGDVPRLLRGEAL